jgi:HAD superfamily hydrolase (TIGR01484 family)
MKARCYLIATGLRVIETARGILSIMDVLILATDYDGTLADDGVVSRSAIDALEELRRSGRRAVLVTGRELPQLLEIFDRTDLFDWIVAENGSLIYRPADGERRVLADAPPKEFVEELKRRGVGPISVGDSIVATWRPHEVTVMEVIRDLKLDREIVFNKDAVMILPSGVNKATGMDVVLEELGQSWSSVVGVGDAENDLAFLSRCQFSVAVANALDSVKRAVDFTTKAPRGQGVIELIEEILQDDLSSRSPHSLRR